MAAETIAFDVEEMVQCIIIHTQCKRNVITNQCKCVQIREQHGTEGESDDSLINHDVKRSDQASSDAQNHNM